MMGTGFGGVFLWWGVLLTLLVGGNILVFRPVTRARVPARIVVEPSAREIFAERVARGDLTWEEYDAILARIGK
jgi:uncharacterized membrane protein